MERRFESEDSTNNYSVNNVFDKLHSEIMEFRESVKSIMGEMHLIKTQIIEKITEVIKTNMPFSNVEVYGSHATQLCLHWSDIDLVLVPPSGSDSPDNWTSPLYTVFNLLNHDDKKSWISSCQFIESANVPVIKLKCSFFESFYQQLIKSGAPVNLQYMELLRKPINIDITLMTDHHNGLECVNLIKEYLAENELIEPMILVVKHMLKVWGYNDPYRGGLSSYALFLMIVSFLQARKFPNVIAEANLGKALLGFMEYYYNFD